MARYTPKPPPGGRNKFDQPKRKEPPVNYESNKTSSEGGYYAAIIERLYGQMSDDLGRAGYFSTPAKEPQQQLDYNYTAARDGVKTWLHKADAQSTGWADVIGNEAAKTALLEAIEHPYVHKALHAHYGIKAPKGVLLYGPPGCGKTMFAKAAANALARLHGKDVEYMLLRANEIESKWVGETEANIRRIFAFARAYQKKNGHALLIFIDEADALLPNRNAVWQFSAQNVATFLAEMDGLDENGAFIVLATNRPDKIDEAVLRDGRIDRKIKVQRPDIDAARQIARSAMARGPFRMDWSTDLVETVFDPQYLLRALTNAETGTTHHFTLAHIVSGAMIVGLVERAKGVAFRRDLANGTLTGVNLDDLKSAVDDLFAEARGLNHDYALREFVETVAIPFETSRQRGALN